LGSARNQDVSEYVYSVANFIPNPSDTLLVDGRNKITSSNDSQYNIHYVDILSFFLIYTYPLYTPDMNRWYPGRVIFTQDYVERVQLYTGIKLFRVYTVFSE